MCFVRVVLRPWAGKPDGRHSGTKDQVSSVRILPISAVYAEIAVAYGAARFSWA